MTRLLLLECSLYGFKNFYELQKIFKDKKMISPRIAIKRTFSTIDIVYNEFKESNGLFNFAFCGTMLQEHFHALIRGMAGGFDTLENTMNCIIKVILFPTFKISLALIISKEPDYQLEEHLMILKFIKRILNAK